jgi:hypothetical protein
LRKLAVVKDVAAVDLRIDTGHGGSVPATLVSLAIAARDRATDEKDEIDEIWCVFDVEWPTNHPDLKNAVDRARANGIYLAISNPCFELWLILHFQDYTRWSRNDEVSRLRRRLDGSTDKGLDASRYMPFVLEAEKRAARLEGRHNRNGTPFPDDNPSSGMHRLIASVEPATGAPNFEDGAW